MKLLGRICILVLCFVAVYASGIKDIIKGQAACSAKLEEERRYINEQTNIQTAQCFLNPNPTVNLTEEQIAAQVNIARSNLTTLQTNLNNCTSIIDDLDFVACVNNDYNENQSLLNNAYAISVNIKNQFDDDTDPIGRYECLSNVYEAAAHNYTAANQEYNRCIDCVLNSHQKKCKK